jgi:glycosyltransferase involved in cell wall biosynthesis
VRIAFLANHRSGNGIYRGIGPMRSLGAYRGHDVRELPSDDRAPLPVADVRDVDVLHVHRYSEDRALTLAREAKEHGAVVVWDNDDDIGAIPRATATHKRHGGYAWHRRLQGMQRMFRTTDLVTTPSATLAERLREQGAPRTEVIENYLQDHFLETARDPHDGVTIGWVAGLEHQVDVERVPVRDALQRLLDERPDVHVTTLGLGLGLRGERYRHVDGVPLIKLCDSIAQFDIGIAPLSDHPFNLARSNVKLKEYASLGAPWLASPIGPYAGMGEKQGGRLVADERWHEELTRLIDKPRERGKLAKRARKWAEGETLARNVHRWEALLADAVERARAAAA